MRLTFCKTVPLAFRTETRKDSSSTVHRSILGAAALQESEATLCFALASAEAASFQRSSSADSAAQ